MMRIAGNLADYEAAFEAFLREKGIPCVAVDEAKKALFANAKLKSFDFVVYSKSGPNLLIDVKGRQMRSAASGATRRSFESWTTEQDVADLMQWEQVFGEGYKAVLTFIVEDSRQLFLAGVPAHPLYFSCFPHLQAPHAGCDTGNPADQFDRERSRRVPDRSRRHSSPAC